MKKDCCQHRWRNSRKQRQHYYGNKYFGKNNLKRMRWLIMEMMLQKEKDLELAAKIGQTLLEQNHELQTKNEFLEEALNASNDIVVQLRHDLQIRSNLLRFYVDNDIDLDGCTAGESNCENFQRKIKRLEDENQSLKNESTNLKKIFSDFEENERLHISEWTKQLDTANEKICHLQHLLGEKTEECGIQSFEVERLLREVAVRCSHEKALANETVDLHQQLQNALAMHEELTAQVVDLQERYAEVMAMLRDAEEELRTYRQNQSAYRVNESYLRTCTPDSLYDSLASEIEASDSGFYSAINNKMQTRQQNVCPKTDMIDVSNKLEVIKASDRRTSNVIETRSIATATDPLPTNQYRRNSHNDDDDDLIDVPNHILAKLLRRSGLSDVSISFLRNAAHPNDSNEPEVSSASKAENRLFEVDAAGTSTPLQRRQFFDRDNVSQYPSWSMHDLSRISGHNSGSSKTESNDSLSGYEAPKMGEPGRPGTRDLDWSIQKLDIRRQVIKDQYF
uniref:HAP1 N-terminal domain-containing protein n=1 Tax=Elaeophora elaphi TaxID=1147741 RepID=A0A0R3RWT8_9BILA